jgi:hypothetical protein
MATFPSLEPASRQISFGDYPQLVYTGTSGATVRFLQGTDRVNQLLKLGFTYLSETQMYLILDHYNGQEGTLLRSGQALPLCRLALNMSGVTPARSALIRPHRSPTTWMWS